MPGALQAAPFVSSALILATLPHHWRVKNMATLSIIAWLTAYNLTYGINAIIWNGNADIRVPVWCDIVTKLKIGADVGLPGSCLCMAKRLNRITYGLDMSPRGWRHRTLDVFLCWGLPVLVMILHVIVQGHRFDIIEDLGCIPAVYVSWPSILILDVSAFIPAVLALFYCAQALFRLYRRHVALRTMLTTTAPSLSPSRYVRLMIMAFVLGAWNTVLLSISTSGEYAEGLQPWTSWAFVHYGFSFIGQFTDDNFDSESLLRIYVLWWAVPISGLSFFLFFGIGADAMKDYRAIAQWMGRVILRRDSLHPVQAGSAVLDLNDYLDPQDEKYLIPPPRLHSLPPHV
ncbi:GPCR fungal pheromone mating factor [Mycena alexandri]|uniref:GPCR fungal pheromone mating factor n=1 Tax=Mycena alexandri TaxID=1745969 RepID=A0AAD6WXK7_9AGAR|nr:GPCR fungal pheromone mating factor [Mycena alexandri]